MTVLPRGPQGTYFLCRPCAHALQCPSRQESRPLFVPSSGRIPLRREAGRSKHFGGSLGIYTRHSAADTGVDLRSRGLPSRSSPRRPAGPRHGRSPLPEGLPCSVCTWPAPLSAGSTPRSSSRVRFCKGPSAGSRGLTAGCRALAPAHVNSRVRQYSRACPSSVLVMSLCDRTQTSHNRPADQGQRRSRGQKADLSAPVPCAEGAGSPTHSAYAPPTGSPAPEEALGGSGWARPPRIGSALFPLRPAGPVSDLSGEESGVRGGHGAGGAALAPSAFGTRRRRGTSASDGRCWPPRDVRASAAWRL